MAYGNYINLNIIVDGVPTGDFKALGTDHPNEPASVKGRWDYSAGLVIDPAPQVSLSLAGADVIGNFSVFANVIGTPTTTGFEFMVEAGAGCTVRTLVLAYVVL